MSTSLPSHLVFILAFVSTVQGLCGDSIRWSHHFDIDDVYGLWYGVGYAQHTPDMTNKPNEVGCVTLYISDVTTEVHDDWLDWSILKRNYTDQNWLSDKSNPWSDTAMSGSWLDTKIRLKRKAKRNIYDERRLRVIWDEDGQTMEQTYVYSQDVKGLWTSDKRKLMEQELMARGIDVWYPNEPPRHPEVIRVLKVTPNLLIINHCSDIGDGGIFSLILRRSPARLQRWEWYDYERLFNNLELPHWHRHFGICAGCVETSSIFHILFCVAVLMLLHIL